MDMCALGGTLKVKVDKTLGDIEGIKKSWLYISIKKV